MKNRKFIKKTACLFAAVCLFTSCKSNEPTSPLQTSSAEANETTAETTTAELPESTAKESAKLPEETTKSAKETSTDHSASESEQQTEEKEENKEKTESSSETMTSEAGSKPEETSAEQSFAEQNKPEESSAQEDKKINIQDIYNTITQTVTLNSPMIVPDNFISNYYGIDVSTLEDYVFSMSEAAISAETIVILKAKDGVSTENLAACLQVVIDQKKSEMENYLPEQFQIVERSSVQIKDSYVYLVISEQADAISQIIQSALE